MDESKKNSAGGKGWEELYWKSHKYNERIKLKTGTYLKAVCPFCDAVLTGDNKLILEVENPEGERGTVEISPYLNVFERRTDLHLPEGEKVKDVKCPACHHSFLVEGEKCGSCGAPIAEFLIGVSNLKVPFRICTTIGCKWHSISNDDENKIILEDSNEW